MSATVSSNCPPSACRVERKQGSSHPSGWLDLLFQYDATSELWMMGGCGELHGRIVNKSPSGETYVAREVICGELGYLCDDCYLAEGALNMPLGEMHSPECECYACEDVRSDGFGDVF